MRTQTYGEQKGHQNKIPESATEGAIFVQDFCDYDDTKSCNATAEEKDAENLDGAHEICRPWRIWVAIFLL